MERRREHTHDIEHFGFDPVSPSTRMKDQTKENDSLCDPSTRDIRRLSYEVATKLSLDESEPQNVSKTCNCKRNSLNSSFKLPDKENTHMADDFWGFDPPVNLGQGSPEQHKYDKLNTSEKPRSLSAQ